MIIKKPARYKLLQDFSIRQRYRIIQLCAGTIIVITQVDMKNHKVIGCPEICDWVGWDMPVEIVKKNEET